MPEIQSSTRMISGKMRIKSNAAVRMKSAGTSTSNGSRKRSAGLIVDQHRQRASLVQLIVGVDGGDDEQQIQVVAIPERRLHGPRILAFRFDDALLPGAPGRDEPGDQRDDERKHNQSDIESLKRYRHHRPRLKRQEADRLAHQLGDAQPHREADGHGNEVDQQLLHQRQAEDRSDADATADQDGCLAALPSGDDGRCEHQKVDQEAQGPEG